MSEAPSYRVRRGRRETNYTAISNRLIVHPNLSVEARLTLIYLLSRPADWQLQINDLRRVLGTEDKPCGRNKTYQVVAELKAHRYVVEHRERIRGGWFSGTTYYVFDEPVECIDTFLAELAPEDTSEPEEEGELSDEAQSENTPKPLKTPLPENRDTVKEAPIPPRAEKRDPVNQHLTKNKPEQNTELPPTPRSEQQPPVSNFGQSGEGAGFSDLWEAWPEAERPDNREAARRVFEKLPKADREHALHHVGAFLVLMWQRREPRRLFPYLKDRLFLELMDAPPQDRDGDFIITPERPEWQAWLECDGGRLASYMAQQGRLICKTRWPEDARRNAHQNGSGSSNPNQYQKARQGTPVPKAQSYTHMRRTL